MNIFVEGENSDDGKLLVSLPSAVVVYLLNYCTPKGNVCINFVHTIPLQERTTVVQLDKKCLDLVDPLPHNFLQYEEVPSVITNCTFPVLQDERDNMVRSGLCCVARHIVKGCHDNRLREGDKTLIDLLGFRAGCLKACAEVSGWTKLCEVELPDSVAGLISSFRRNGEESIEIPVDVMKLELHFEKPPPMHNDDKKKREVLKRVNKEVDEMSDVVDTTQVSHFFRLRETELPHGNMYYRIITKVEKEDKRFDNTEKEEVCQFGCTEEKLVKWCAKCNDREKLKQKERQIEKNRARLIQNGQEAEDSDVVSSEGFVKSVTGVGTLDELTSFVQSLTIQDVQYEHRYAEGVSFSLADIVVFVYLYHLMKSMEFRSINLLRRIPCVHKWLQHIVSLPRIQQAAAGCGFNMGAVRACLEGGSDYGGRDNFVIPEVALDVDEESNDIVRRNKGKHKALKKEIARVLEKVKEESISAPIGQHPYGKAVQLPWETVPTAVHPKQELPEKRVARKCEQLENLATAVQSVAREGDIIVDFCSGGGHLGLIIAYLLPKCKVYLVENKEESLLRAWKRVNDLKLSNVTLYQCNLDYFCGHFDVGVCLHACGVATDLVLQQCLDRKAAFVICPCCYGSIQNTHLISYPRSQGFRKSGLTDKDVIVLGHAADQTEAHLELQAQGRHCMNLVDTDRAQLAREEGYTVTLCSLHPLTCTPKNNLLIGTRAVT